MKYYSSLVILLAFVCSMSAKSFDTKELSQYVFPNNQAKSPTNFIYMPDGLTYLTLSKDGKTILQYNTENAKLVDTIIDVNNTRETSIDKIDGFQLSKDGNKLIVYNNSESIYRRSYYASHYVFDIKRNILKQLSKNYSKQRAPIFSPDGRMVAFVADNNIHIKKLDYDSEVAVTNDGKQNSIINGVPDWTYEEEFMVTSSMVWAPDNLTLCFIKYNENDVESFSFPIYAGVCNSNSEYELYNGNYTYKYPKAGSKNSKVTVHSYDIETRKIKEIKLDSKIEYVPRISYANNENSLVISTLNRNQNEFNLLLVNPKTTVIKSIYKDISKSWIDEICYSATTFYPDYFVVCSAKSGFNHLYKYSYSGIELDQITSGDFDVTAYYGQDKKGNYYFQSTRSGAINRVVSKVNTKGEIVNVSKDSGFSSISFSPTMNYYVCQYSSSKDVPQYTLFNAANKQIRVLENNSQLNEKYLNMPKREFFEFDSYGVKLNGYIVKPTYFNPTKKYPVIMTLYNGPASQVVLNKWSVDWENYYAMQGYIVACVDGHGTAGRGQSFQSKVYKRLGYYETIDQIAAAKYMQSLSYVDENKIGIFGWSYGGYETLMAISHKDSPYKAAVAVAPVTDWRYYDTAYTERFMLTPQENEDGYIEGSTLNKVKNVNCPLLIMSGTADDNVHLSNTMEYVSHLIDEGKYCDMFLFPNMNHSIYGCNSRTIVYAKMLDFFNLHLK